MTLPSLNDDRELVTRCAQGDSAAFAQLVKRYHRRALRVAFGLVRSRPDAEDVVQEAFIKASRHIDEFRAQSGFYTWFYRIVVNLSIDRLRKLQRERRSDVDDEETRDVLSRGQTLWPTFERNNPAAAFGRDELRGMLETAFQALPEIHQKVLLLREIDGMSYSDIAETLAIKKGTVMSRLFHARRTMQAELTALNVRDPASSAPGGSRRAAMAA